MARPRPYGAKLVSMRSGRGARGLALQAQAARYHFARPGGEGGAQGRECLRGAGHDDEA